MWFILTVPNFESYLFVKEASDDQLKNLVVDSEQGEQVTEEEVEALIKEQPKNKARLRGVC